MIVKMDLWLGIFVWLLKTRGFWQNPHTGISFDLLLHWWSMKHNSCDFRIKSSLGVFTPASPWMGSTKKPTIFGRSCKTFSSATGSLYGIVMNPGVNGPKSFWATGSEEKDTMVVVLPWKLFWQTTISRLDCCKVDAPKKNVKSIWG